MTDQRPDPLAPFWIALQFLTRLPVPSRPAQEESAFGRALLAFPLVGALVGALLLVPVWIWHRSDPFLLAALVVALWAGLTGALHLDGLADSADAWLGGHGDAARTLNIMKDPCAGPAGVTSIVVVLLLKGAALAALLRAGHWEALVAAPLLGRTAALALMVSTPYVRPGGLGSGFVGALPAPGTGAVAIGAAMLAAWWLLGWGGGWVLLAAALLFWLARRQMTARIGGTTGDTAGAVVELIEAAVLTAAALHV